MVFAFGDRAVRQTDLDKCKAKLVLDVRVTYLVLPWSTQGGQTGEHQCHKKLANRATSPTELQDKEGEIFKILLVSSERFKTKFH